MRKLYAMYYDGNVFGLARATGIEEINASMMNNIKEALEGNDYALIYDTEPYEFNGMVYDAQEECPVEFPIEPVYRITTEGIYDMNALKWVE